jgi:two-component sensor histidine kinase
MFVQRFLLVFFFLLGSLYKASTHPLTPKIDSLVEQVSKLTYDHEFQEAQELVLTYLKQDNLSPIEVFYGHYLRADINKSSGKSTNAISLLFECKKYLAPVEENKTILESLLYGNISECYFNLSQHAKAKKYALLSIQLNPDKTLRKNGHAVNHLIIGFSDYTKKNYGAALEAYHKAIEEYRFLGELCELPLCYNKIAATYWEQHEYSLAEQALEKSLFISDSCNIDQYRLLSNITLFEYYKYREDYKSALDLVEKINSLTTSIYTQQQSHALHHLGIKYEVELTKKENQNLKINAKIEADDNRFQRMILIGSILGLLFLLTLGFFMLRVRNKKNTLLSDQLQKIEVQNKEREALLKEVHHRVKNNLQVITSLLHLQANQNSDQNIQNLFKQSQHRINTMAMVHEMLYQSDNLSKIQLKAYLEELTNSLIKSIKGAQQSILTHIEIPENIYLGIDTAIPLGLLSNEIITNSLIHGIPKSENGKIYIRVEEKEAGSFNLHIGDNGIGCPKDLTLKKVSTLGLILVQKLSRQLSGSIEKDQSKKGCHYKITFKEVL